VPAADFSAEFPYASRFLDLEGARCAYVDEGAGPPVLLVHGNPTWSFAWRRFIADLRVDHRVIAVDHVGCGRSDKPVDYPYRLARHVDNLQRLVAQLDLREVTLVGHDWGGCIGVGAALRDPGRYARFVLCNTAAFRSRRIPWRIAACRWPVFGPLAVRGLNLFSRMALWMAVHRRERLTPAARAGYLAPYDSWAHRAAVQAFVEDIPLSAQHPSYQTLADIERGLPTLATRPMLLLWGARDWCFTLEFFEEWRRRFPLAESEVYADAGHYVFEDAWEEMLPRLRRFLKDGH
jgi:haloalkane dehalogenase